MGDRINNMGKMMSNPKQRNMYLLGAGAVVITLGLGFYIASKNKDQQVQSSAQVESVPGNVKAVPGSSNNPDYVQSVKNINDKEAIKAMQSGSSYVPTITSPNVNNASSLDEIARRQQQEAEQKAKKEAEKKKAEEEDRLRMEDEAKKQQALIDSQKPVPVNQAPQMMQTQMQAQVPAAPVVQKKYTDDDYMLIATLNSSWQNKKSSAEFDFAKQKPKDQTEATNTMGTATPNGTGTSTNNVTVTPLAKAGTIFNAVIETSVNSDEDSPVLARIVSGPLKGTRLIGTFKNLGEKVAVVFNTANIPTLDKSVRLNAYAVDTKTSRTAMADDVNHHYFLRYGVLLATSFVSGYAQALQQNNQTTTVTPLGGVVTVPNGNLSSKDINKQALGQVGNQVANDVKQQYNNLRPTIYVNSGTAVGILLMDDLSVK